MTIYINSIDMSSIYEFNFPIQVEEVASMVENNTEVGSLTLRNVSLGNDGVKQLTTVLKTSANVKVWY